MPDRFGAVDSMQVDTLRLAVLLPFGLQVDTLEGGMLPRKTVRLRQMHVVLARGGRPCLNWAKLACRLSQVLDETPDSLGRPQYRQAPGRADVVVGPLMRENVGVVAPKIDRLGKQHILLTNSRSATWSVGLASECRAHGIGGVEKLARWVSAKRHRPGRPGGHRGQRRPA